MTEDAARLRMLKAAMAAPYLGREEEHELTTRWKEDRDQDACRRQEGSPRPVGQEREIADLALGLDGDGLGGHGLPLRSGVS